MQVLDHRSLPLDALRSGSLKFASRDYENGKPFHVFLRLRAIPVAGSSMSVTTQVPPWLLSLISPLRLVGSQRHSTTAPSSTSASRRPSPLLAEGHHHQNLSVELHVTSSSSFGEDPIPSHSFAPLPELIAKPDGCCTSIHWATCHHCPVGLSCKLTSSGPSVWPFPLVAHVGTTVAPCRCHLSAPVCRGRPVRHHTMSPHDRVSADPGHLSV
uniref:Uncharacterized protein n=1 Tax=Oryza sativa subsp. japonica TaxID=39947 RepID=Q69Y82_ORYSJ|nr:hypothetical protein [Oryza sativa Japonica Group]